MSRNFAVIPRRSWGARYTNGYGSATRPATEAWLHHSVALHPDLEFDDLDGDGLDDDDERAMRQIEEIGEQRFGSGASYHRVSMPGGPLYVGIDSDRRGAHVAGRNRRSIGYCLAGRYDQDRVVTDMQVEAIARDLVRQRQDGVLITARIRGPHSEAPGAATDCPGRHGRAAIPQINARAAEIEALGLDPDLMGDDMPLTDSDIERLVRRFWAWRIPMAATGDRQPAELVLGQDVGHHARIAAARSSEALAVLSAGMVDEERVAALLSETLVPAVVTALPQVTGEQVEQAIRSVLGSLDSNAE